MPASFIGMALPCMLSLQFIRNATVAGDRVAAMTAEGIAMRYPDYGGLFWTLTLLCGFLVLAPGQISVGDQIARRWTDIIWTASSRVKRLGGTRVKYVYYSILSVYAVWGLFVLWRLPALILPRSAPCWATSPWAFRPCTPCTPTARCCPRRCSRTGCCKSASCCAESSLSASAWW